MPSDLEYALQVNICNNLCHRPCCIKWMLTHFSVHTRAEITGNRF